MLLLLMLLKIYISHTLPLSFCFFDRSVSYDVSGKKKEKTLYSNTCISQLVRRPLEVLHSMRYINLRFTYLLTTYMYNIM